ncbi:hypothetical protein GCM10023170_083860 [Phytohabitans houttuyneae]|uniref:DUF11 domain-containing protein n=2 Tax=Phytohabitans houttuyneae TaxID=1076126 RepID=A0A6V8K6C4_9ACTN|nr:hypothetical protein Phou_049330 [Phytohabitans houttuyneae]
MHKGSPHPNQSKSAVWMRSISVMLAFVLVSTFAISAPAHAALVISSFSGTLAPGASQNHVWNNVPANTAYKVGLSPVGASTSAMCEFEVTNQWYERLSTGERKFHWTIKNIGTLACGTNVLLSAISSDSIQSTGGMEPSEIKTFSVQLTAFGDVFEVPLLGLVPSGATSANPCRFKVRRTWYQRVAQGDVAQPVYLRYEVQNTGNIACSADVQKGAVPVESRLSAKSLGGGSSSSTRWNNATPTSATHLIGLDPVELGCAMEVTRNWYRQVVNSTGTTERELVWTMKNLGTTQCSAERVLSRI